MERVVERDNLIRALKQVKRNGGSPGIDGMTVEELAPYLKDHWPRLKEALLEGHVCAPTGEAGRDPEAGRRGAQAGDSHGGGSLYSTSDLAGASAGMGPGRFRSPALDSGREGVRTRQ